MASSWGSTPTSCDGMKGLDQRMTIPWGHAIRGGVGGSGSRVGGDGVGCRGRPAGVLSSPVYVVTTRGTVSWWNVVVAYGCAPPDRDCSLHQTFRILSAGKYTMEKVSPLAHRKMVGRSGQI
ncbi:hypothetical protein L873DRAFT_1820588 [Choiromyces venosus 120613-1]|uniref:Uncharacterized protein n=1 Tax=Choiromyces venosus 120613-1 TaxID=1336337 RepID=A0A3N4IXQ2_9PEZI|nr:hypothetical protein L873DRAFT_1820588 [Choiromyces venosus 120613-1]